MQVSDTGAVEPVVEAVLAEHPDNVQEDLGGKQKLIGFFIGQVTQAFPGSPDPKLVRELLQAKLEARRS